VGGGGLEGGQDDVKDFYEKCVWTNYTKLQAIQGSKLTKMKGILKHKS